VLKRFVAPLIVLTALAIVLVMQFVAAQKVNKPAHGHLKLLGIGPADSPFTDNNQLKQRNITSAPADAS
jgi:hypothetical protein